MGFQIYQREDADYPPPVRSRTAKPGNLPPLVDDDREIHFSVVHLPEPVDLSDETE